MMCNEIPEEYWIPNCFETYIETPYEELKKMKFHKELFYGALSVEHLLTHFKESIKQVKIMFIPDDEGCGVWEVNVKAFNNVGYPLYFVTSSKFNLHAAVFSACVLLYKKQRKDEDEKNS